MRGPCHRPRSRDHRPDTSVHRTSAIARDDDVVLPADARRIYRSAGTFVSAIMLAALVGLTSCAGGRHASAGPTTVTTAAASASSSPASQASTAPTTARASQSGRLFSVLMENRNWVDASRSTVAYRGSAGQRARELPTRIFIPARDGQAALQDGPFPLFVWAHGLDATVRFFEPFLRAVAARGYVVVAPTFPLTRAGLPGGADLNDYVHQPADVSFVIGEMLAADGPHGTDHPGLVDPTRIAAGGHSLGAVTTMGLVSNRCCTDARVKAAVEIDGARLSFAGGGTIQRGVPVLLIHGDADRMFSVNESRAIYRASSPPKYLVVLHGMPHTAFEIPSAFATIVNTVGDFLDAYLKHDPDGIRHLQDNAAVPGLATVTSAP
jgi:dienelactone hydrolase